MLVTCDAYRKFYLATRMAGFYSIFMPMKKPTADEVTFSDEQVTEACGLHIDNLRRLITWGAVKPLQSGGGRGRVRTWSFLQALRIALTSEFFEAGFSLRMAHTLTCCLPLDDLLYQHFPDFVKSPRPDEWEKFLLSPAVKDKWPKWDWGGQVIIFDRLYAYSDVLGPFELFGVFRKGGLQFCPIGRTESLTAALIAMAAEIVSEYGTKGTESLLVDPKAFSNSKTYFAELHRIIRDVPQRIKRVDDIRYRNLCRINPNTGLLLAARRLMGLPTRYPFLEPKA